MTHAIRLAARRIISDAATVLFHVLYPVCPPHEAGARWLAIRSWVRRDSPRPPIRRYVRRVARAASRERREAGRVELRDMPQRVAPEVPWRGIELAIAEGLAAGESYREVGRSLGISPSSVARRVAAMREEVTHDPT